MLKNEAHWNAFKGSDVMSVAMGTDLHRSA